jgi:LAS superfamily LD-carboxypeptidase LdcB
MSPRRADHLTPRERTPVSSTVLTGRTDRHLCSEADAESLGARVHGEVVEPFRRLQADARAAGFDLRSLSGFRSFDQQRSIWNRKVTGRLAVLDSDAVPLDIARLSEPDLIFAILRWSALPGASRHHWGTDLDVYDRAAQPEGYEIELIPAEVNAGGMFGPLHQWLDQRIAAGAAHGFFRPYDRDRGGVAPERWHLSHAPVAGRYLPGLTVPLLRRTIERADLGLKPAVLAHLDEIHRRFVVNVNPAAA